MTGWLRPVAAGFVLGATWGVLARVWMRLISTNPEFSWSGTAMIIGFAASAGALLGLVRAARTRRRRPVWRLAALPGLVLFAGPGLVFLPALLLGGWSWGSRRPRVLRAVVALPPLVAPILLWRSTPLADRLLVSPWIFVGGFGVLSVALAAAGAVWLAPWPQLATRPETRAVVVA